MNDRFVGVCRATCVLIVFAIVSGMLSVVAATSARALSTASATMASFTYPLNGATNVDTSKPFTWTTVSGAQTYYLYVGTSQGAKDLVDTGGIAATLYAVPALPVGPTLWGRIWTKLNNAWTYQDVSFTAATNTTARFTYPKSGSQGVDPAMPFAWTSVPGSPTYYLYVGTSQGAKDLVDSGGTTATSYAVPALPVGPTLWGRIWTKLNNAWTYQDASFTAAPPSRARFIYPQNGSTTVDTSQGFSWSSVPSGQAYYLYVGTTQGAKDLVNSAATTATTYPVPPLPTGQLLWARLWTEVNGVWAYYVDISFQVSISASRLTYPRPGQTNVNSLTPFTWSAVPGTIAYYLNVGTSPGASDVVNSGSTTATSFAVPPLPIGQLLYARLYTNLTGNWNVHTDLSFTVAYSAGKLTYPVRTGPNVDASKPFTWTPIVGAQGYRLWIGTSPGASDVVNSGQLAQPSYATGPLPVGGALWARAWTLASGSWLYSQDLPFSPAATITAPAQQSMTVDRSQPLSWAPGAVLNGRQPSYQLIIGSKPGANDLFDSGVVSVTSMTVPAPAMPAGKPLYAQVKVNLGDGSQRRADNVFATSGTTVVPAQMTWGSGGSAAVDTSQPFTWTTTDFAQGYRLQVLSGATTVVDTGVTWVPEYFAESLATGTYTAQLGTEIGGQWTWAVSPFTVTSSGSSAANEISGAHWAVDFVRHMADTGDFAYGWTDLAAVVNVAYFSWTTECADYSDELLKVLKMMNVAALQPAADQPQRFNTYFNSFNGDTKVEFWDSADSDWIVMDPTFDIAMQRASDGHWATIADAHQATVNRNWAAITYIPLGDYGFTLANAYYLDYPLLYLNPPGQSPWLDPLLYMTALNPMPTNRYSVYGITSSQSPVTILEDGQPHTITISGPDTLSKMFSAATVSLPPGNTATVTVYTPNRYVF